MDALANPSPIPTSPRPLFRSLTPQPHTHTQARKSSRPSAVSPGASARGTPVASPPPLPTDSEPASKSTAGMSKEERANEMARRKEERRLVRVLRSVVCETNAGSDSVLKNSRNRKRVWQVRPSNLSMALLLQLWIWNLFIWSILVW